MIDYAKKHCFCDEEMWREKVLAIYVNGQNQILAHQVISVGTSDMSIIDKKLVIKGALDAFAHGVILFHNHPSGNCLPSKADIIQTLELKKACNIMDLNILDHIILSDKEWYSFAEERKYNLKAKKS